MPIVCAFYVENAVRMESVAQRRGTFVKGMGPEEHGMQSLETQSDS